MPALCKTLCNFLHHPFPLTIRSSGITKSVKRRKASPFLGVDRLPSVRRRSLYAYPWLDTMRETAACVRLAFSCSRSHLQRYAAGARASEAASCGWNGGVLRIACVTCGLITSPSVGLPPGVPILSLVIFRRIDLPLTHPLSFSSTWRSHITKHVTNTLSTGNSYSIRNVAKKSRVFFAQAFESTAKDDI